MGSLAGKSPSLTYKSLLKVSDETNGVSAATSQVEDGEGTSTCISISDDQLAIKPQNDDSTSAFVVKKSDNTSLLTIDSTNSLVKVGTSQVSATTQLLTFNAFNLAPTASGTHMVVGLGGLEYNSGMAERTIGTGTDPSTSLNSTTTTDDYTNALFPVPYNIVIDAVKVLSSSTTDTDTTLNFHLMSYDMTADGTTSDGDLSNGTVLADGQATSVDRSVTKSTDLTIQSSSVTSGKVIMCTVENETNTNSINLQVQVKYHIA